MDNKGKGRDAALARSLREIEIRNRIAEVFLTTTGEDTFVGVLEILLDVFQSRFGVFGFIDEDGALVVPTMTRHIWDQCEMAEKRIVFPRETWGDSIWPTALRRKEILHSNVPSKLTPEGHITVERNLAAPIVLNDAVIGLLQVANKETDYDAEDLAMARVIADAIAPILGARLEREREEQRRERAEEALREQHWLRSGQAALAEVLRGESEPRWGPCTCPTTPAPCASPRATPTTVASGRALPCSRRARAWSARRLRRAGPCGSGSSPRAASAWCRASSRSRPRSWPTSRSCMARS
ncbi:MAG: GAF domain-containing protein [Pseudomonadota bacterium]